MRGHYKKNFTHGYNGEILKICMTAGGISYNGLKLMNGDRETYTNAIRKLKKENILSVKWVGRNCIATFTNFDNVQELFIDDYISYLGTYTRYISQKSKALGWYKSAKHKSESIKAFRYSDIVMLLYGTSVKTLTSDKPKLYKDEIVTDGDAYFYSDTEVKALVGGTVLIDDENKNEKFIVTSRAQGFIVSSGGVYMMYHTGGTNRMAWRTSQEQQMKFRTAKFVTKYFNGNYSLQEISDCIVYADTINPFVEIFNDETLNKKNKYANYMSLENGYANTYFLPYSKEGQYLTDFMVHKNWKERMIDYFIEDDSVKKAKIGSVADLNDGEHPILLFCIPNATRLYKFLLNAEIVDKEFHVYCFDFQEEFLNAVVDGKAKIFSTPFEDFIKAMDC